MYLLHVLFKALNQQWKNMFREFINYPSEDVDEIPQNALKLLKEFVGQVHE